MPPLALPFLKMHGIGNDYVFIDGRLTDFPDPMALAPKISDRHTGVGSDGLVLMLPSADADVRMRMFNADGSEGESCGNALRCIAKYERERGNAAQPHLTIETLGGIVHAECHEEGGRVISVTINMGRPRFRREEILMVPGEEPVRDFPVESEGRTFAVTAVSMGNPHAVSFVEGWNEALTGQFGPALERHPFFPRRTNVEFCEIISPGEVNLLVWERGSGITQACGSGACATIAAGVVTGRLERKVLVHLLGGDLQIEYRDSGEIFMTGQAAIAFEGNYLWDPEQA